MTDATTLPADALTGEQAIALVKTDPASVLVNPERWERFFAAIKADLRKEPCDLSTEKGRKAIASAAYRVTQTKTAIDGAAKKLKAGINKVQGEIYDQLEKLAIETRAPLTTWEEAEKARTAKCEAIIDNIRRLSKVEWNDTSDAVINRLFDVEAIELDPVLFGDGLEQAQATRQQAIETMNAAVERLDKEEADKAELQRLRDEQARREAEDVARAAAEAKRIADEEALKAAASVVTGPQPEPEPEPEPAPTEASIAQAAMPKENGAQRQDSVDGPAPSADRQSTVNEASKQDAARLEVIDAVLPYFDGDSLEDCIDQFIDAIIDGKIPHVAFTA